MLQLWMQLLLLQLDVMVAVVVDVTFPVFLYYKYIKEEEKVPISNQYSPI